MDVRNRLSDVMNGYFSKQLFVLKIFGVSLSGNEGIIYKVYSVVILTLAFMHTIFEGIGIYQDKSANASEYVIYEAAAILSFCKYVFLFQYRKGFVNVLNKLGGEPFRPNIKRGGYREEELVKECVWISNMQAYIYWTVGATTLIGTFIYAIINRIRNGDYHSWQFPYGRLTIFDLTRSPNYEIIIFYQNIAIFVMAAIFTTVDLLVSTIMGHISYQYKMLHNNINRLISNSYEKMIEDKPSLKEDSTAIKGSDIPYIYLKMSLKECVQYHTAINNVAAEFEDMFSNLSLVLLFGTMTVLCFGVFITTAAVNNLSAIRHILESMCGCFQVVVLCYWGEQVIKESLLVGNAVSEMNFVGTDLRFQKMLAFIIRRSQNPTQFTAGKFTQLSLATSLWLFRTTYSAFMVLQRTNHPK